MIVTGTRKGAFKINLETNELHKFQETNKQFTNIEFSNNNKILLSYGKRVKLININESIEYISLFFVSNVIKSEISHNERFIVTLCKEYNKPHISIYDLTNNNSFKIFLEVHPIDFCIINNNLITIQQGTILINDIESGILFNKYHVSINGFMVEDNLKNKNLESTLWATEEIRSFPNKNMFVTRHCKFLCVWNFDYKLIIKIILNLYSHCNAVDISNETIAVMTLNENNETYILVYNINNGLQLDSFKFHKYGTSLCYCNSNLAIGTDNGDIFIIDSNTKDIIKQYHTNTINVNIRFNKILF